jgi:hypothetical protein
MAFDRNSNIGYISHMVGSFLGMALAFSLLRTKLVHPDRGEQTLLMWFAGQGPIERDKSRRAPRRSSKLSRRID